MIQGFLIRCGRSLPVFVLALALGANVLADDKKDASTNTNVVVSAATKTNGWETLFDGKTLNGWKITDFGASGEVKVEKGEIKIDMGNELTGINYTNKDLPKMNYEIELDAMKIDGTDFFCGLTFPVKDSFCSFIVGGWGGGVVGLSSLDGMDASENDTSKSRYFEKNRWFHIRVRVEPERIQTWIDNEQLVDVNTKDRKVALRPGPIEESKPMGIAAWQTSAAIKNIRMRKF